jgi:hypothetical protein
MAESIFTVCEDILDRRIGDDLLVHRFDNDDVFVLNGHARLVFEALKAGGTLETVRAHVAAAGFVSSADSDAVERAVGEMIDQGIAVRQAS